MLSKTTITWASILLCSGCLNLEQKTAEPDLSVASDMEMSAPIDATQQVETDMMINLNLDGDIDAELVDAALADAAQDREVEPEVCIDEDGDQYGDGAGCIDEDCNDEVDTINASADELCDGIDNDCDQVVDEGLAECEPPRCGDGIVGPTEECDDANIIGGDGCSPSCSLEDLCDFEDDDQDGEVDEKHYDVPTALEIKFSESTVLGDLSRIEILEHNRSPIYGSPFEGDSLAGQTVYVQGNHFYIRLVVEQGGDPTRGYQIEEIRSPSARLISGPYPAPPRDESGLVLWVNDAIDDTQWFEAGDSLGTGLRCGTSDVGACQFGRTSCLTGIVTCQGDVNPSQEVCDCLDNDCDGLIDHHETGSLGCTFNELAPHGRDRHCTVQASGDIASGVYEFGTLTVPNDIDLNVTPPADPEDACGFVGEGGCMKAGGCLNLIANTITISGTVNVNAETASIDGGNCGGSSGGDLLISTNELHINGGTLQANGSPGSHFTAETGGGAAGRIRIHAQQTTLSQGTIECKGGSASPNPGGSGYFGDHGGGPGGSGGSGGSMSEDRGGGGAGGPGRNNGEGGDQNPNRPLEILGGLQLDADSAISAENGIGNPSGFVKFGGQSSIYGREQFNLITMTVYPLAIRVRDAEASPVVGSTIRFQYVDDAGITQVQTLGTTDEDGWLKVSSDNFTFVAADTYTVLGLPEFVAAKVFVSYGFQGVECNHQFDYNGSNELVIPNFSRCGSELP